MTSTTWPERYEFFCPDCETEIVFVVHCTSGDDGGYRRVEIMSDTHEVAQPMWVDKRTGKPALVCRG